MRAAPFIVVLAILVFGVFSAFDTLSSPQVDTLTASPRPTLTPRPRPTSPRPSDTATPVPEALVAPTPAPTTLAAPVAQEQPTSAPTRVAQQMMKVGNTDREGVYLRRTPNMDDKIRPWMDGTPMTVLAQPVTVNGVTWLKVRAPDGVEGYIPSQYLVPQN